MKKRASILSIFKRTCCVLVLLFSFFLAANGKAFELSDSSRISLLTCSSGEDLYSAFGHTAIRVIDYKQNIDVVFNYGTFDYDQPGFYLNFLRGQMRYMVSMEDFRDFMVEYIMQKRSVGEQELNLNQEDKKKVFDFLYHNAMPENREYRYDFFWDNCATRPRDVFEKILGNRIHYHTDTAGFKNNYTLHDMLRLYIHDRPWVDFGFDVSLGLPCEKIATPRDQTFLPDYTAMYLACAEVDGKPFVSKNVSVLDFPAVQIKCLILPVYITLLLLLAGVMCFFFERKNKMHYYKVDFAVFLIAGFIGTCLLSLWLFTVHYSVPKNMNMLWLLPSHFFVSFLLLKKQKPAWTRYYFLVSGIIAVLIFITWKWNPQPLNYAFAPIIILLAARSFSVYNDQRTLG